MKTAAINNNKKEEQIMWKFRTLARRFLQEEDGVGVVEIILVLVVLIGLVVIFKSQLTGLVQSLLDKVVSQSNSI